MNIKHFLEFSRKYYCWIYINYGYVYTVQKTNLQTILFDIVLTRQGISILNCGSNCNVSLKDSTYIKS